MLERGLRLSAIARHFGVDYHTVDKAIRWYRWRCFVISRSAVRVRSPAPMFTGKNAIRDSAERPFDTLTARSPFSAATPAGPSSCAGTHAHVEVVRLGHDGTSSPKGAERVRPPAGGRRFGPTSRRRLAAATVYSRPKGP